MITDRAYQLAAEFFYAGKSGKPIPEIPDGFRVDACRGAYESGVSAGMWRDIRTCTLEGGAFVLREKNGNH